MKDIYSKREPMRKPHVQFRRATQHFAKKWGEKPVTTSGRILGVNVCVCMYISLWHTAVGG